MEKEGGKWGEMGNREQIKMENVGITSRVRETWGKIGEKRVKTGGIERKKGQNTQFSQSHSPHFSGWSRTFPQCPFVKMNSLTDGKMVLFATHRHAPPRRLVRMVGQAASEPQVRQADGQTDSRTETTARPMQRTESAAGGQRRGTGHGTRTVTWVQRLQRPHCERQLQRHRLQPVREHIGVLRGVPRGDVERHVAPEGKGVRGCQAGRALRHGHLHATASPWAPTESFGRDLACSPHGAGGTRATPLSPPLPRAPFRGGGGGASGAEFLQAPKAPKTIFRLN